MRRDARMQDEDQRYGYTAVGHVTADVMEDGSRRPGGTAFYAALQAARLGVRTLIITRGVPREIEGLLEPHRHELDLRVIAAQETTTLATSGTGTERTQRVLAWAGAFEGELALCTRIAHIAPVAREGPHRLGGSAQFLGLTPQGMVRRWDAAQAPITLEPACPGGRRARLAGISDAIVVSEHEVHSCGSLIAAARAGGAVVAVTHGPRPTTLLHADGTQSALEVAPLREARDDLGAGDVFAAAFFLALQEGRGDTGSALYANAAAAVRMMGTGARAIGDATAIEKRLAETGG